MYALPFSRFTYHINNEIINYTSCEKDLGVIVHEKLKWNNNCISLTKKANQQLGLLRRTLFFTKNSSKRRVFYRSIVRSIFEHCSHVWKPTNTTFLSNVEKLQRRAVKWILGEQFGHYTIIDYNSKLKKLDLMPLEMKMKFSDLLLFYKIVNNLSPLKLPTYITPINPTQRSNTRASTKALLVNDTLLYECTLKPTPTLTSHSICEQILFSYT